MNLATWSIRNPIPAILLFVLLTLAGLWGFRALPIQSFPDLELPTINVTLVQPGAAPAQLETEVARKVEDSLATLSGLRHLRTSITDGQVAVIVEFELEKNLSDALIETKNAVDRVRSDLPTDLEQPTVSAVNVVGDPIQLFSVASTRMDEEALSWFVDDTVAKAVLGVPGVGRFERVGGTQREVRVEVDPVRLAALGVTAADVSRALRQVQQESSGGRAQLGTGEQSVRTIATVRQASELDAFPIALPGGREVRLDQVATIRDGIADRTQAALLNGEPVLGFRVYRAKGFDETRVAEGVREALARLKAGDSSLRFTAVSGSVGYTLEQYAGSMAMLYEGALLAVLVVWVFLRDWRATVVAAAALPLSILPTFAAMAWLGYSLNTLTLLALAVVVGILVDDAIVEVENIERHSRKGKPILQATADAVTEIALAVVATTISLVVVFLPTALMSGVPGLFFQQFGWTAVIAVMASLLVARLLTPMMAAYLLKPHAGRERPDGRIMRWYLSAVTWCLAHRRTTVLAAAGFFAASLALVPWIPTGLVPPSDRGYTSVNVELPPGSSLQNTVEVLEMARMALADVPGISSVFTTVGDSSDAGGGMQQAGEVRRGALTLTLAPRGERAPQVEIENAIRQKLLDVPGARFTLSSGGVGEKLQLILASDNNAALKASAQALERELRSVGLSNVNSTASLERPEIVVRPDVRRAAERGVTTAAIGDARGHQRGFRRAGRAAEPGQPAAVHPRADAGFGSRESRDDCGSSRGGAGRACAARERCQHRRRERAFADRSLRSFAIRHRERGPWRHAAGGRGGCGDGLAGGEIHAVQRPAHRGGRCGACGRARGRVRDGDRRRRAVRVLGARVAVQGLPAAGHDPVRDSLVARRGARGAADRAQRARRAGDDRPRDADGHRDEELDPARRIRRGGHARPGDVAAGCADRCLSQTGPPDRHDDGGDDRRDAAGGARARGGCELPPAHGDCRDRWAHHVHGAQPARRAGGVHVCRRV
jgi:multidrug efflux pump subunit AcrB